MLRSVHDGTPIRVWDFYDDAEDDDDAGDLDALTLEDSGDIVAEARGFRCSRLSFEVQEGEGW